MVDQIKKPALVETDEALGQDYIYQLEGFKFDQQRLIQDYIEITDKLGIDRSKHGQFNLHVRGEAIADGLSDAELFFDFSGSLNAQKNHRRNVSESEFDTIHPILAGTYTEEVMKQIFAFSYITVGRVRWLLLNPKTCYSMHRDPDWYRLHIPLKTTEKNFFIVNEKYFTMPEEGGLYVIHPQEPHTAVNSELFETRLHLVFDTADELQLY
jgi:hypothetical protein